MGKWILILVAVLFGLALLFFLLLFLLSRRFFGPGKTYDVTKALSDSPELLARVLSDREKVASYPSEEVSVVSFDGLTLFGNLYRSPCPAGRVVLCMHGYHSAASSDFCGALDFFLQNGFDVLAVTQRCHGKSGGRSITFGVKERYDCRTWCEYLLSRFGESTDVVLDGVSMGATTVLMASDREIGLPSNVRAAIADCGFTSPWEIVCDVAKKTYGLSGKWILEPFRLVTRLAAGFDMKGASATDAVARASFPIFFAHGSGDDFVPFAMSQKNFEACSSECRLFCAEGAGHGLSFLVEEERYKSECMEFLGKFLRNK